MMSQAGKRRQKWDIRRLGTRPSSSRRPCRERGGTYADLAREPGCDAGSISDWVKKADASQASASDNPFQLAEENRRLKREVERLRRENEILLKASAFFASRQL